MKSKTKFLTFLAIYCAISFSSALAQWTDPVLQNRLVNSELMDWTRKFIGVLMSLIIAGSVLTIIIGAYHYMAATGNPEALQRSKHTITMAVIVVVIMFLAWGILGNLAPQLTPLYQSLIINYVSPLR